jgi:hydroxymethylpyrimidine/phosphomethylpyrimidine kinase
VSGASSVKRALTIAGSDPSGGAGIQADLKTFSRLRVYGMAVIAAMTAQNTLGVSGIAEVPPEFVQQQLTAVLDDIRPDATKTGMLLTAGVIEVVARSIREHAILNLVVDPVMISTSGAALMADDAAATFRSVLIPLAFLITPNLNEAGALTGTQIRTVSEMEKACVDIHAMGARNVLIKGGHLEGDEARDILFDGKDLVHFAAPRVPTPNTHGTGCVLSAAITAHLAGGKPVKEAIELGKDFVTRAIKSALQIGKGIGPCDPLGLGHKNDR